jgi:hypothetical protein
MGRLERCLQSLLKKKRLMDCEVVVQEIAGSTQLQLTTIGSIISIAFFNFFGISVTKNLSGVARCTIDACRTLFVWMFSLYADWEKFHGLEVRHASSSSFLS